MQGIKEKSDVAPYVCNWKTDQNHKN